MEGGPLMWFRKKCPIMKWVYYKADGLKVPRLPSRIVAVAALMTNHTDKDRSDKWLTRVARSGDSYSRCVRTYCRLSTQSVAYAHIYSLDNAALR